RGEDAVQPAGNGSQRLGDDLLSEDVGKGQVAVLKELTPDELDLLPECPLVRMAHLWASLPLMERVAKPHLRKRGPLCLCHFGRRTCRSTTCHSCFGPERATDIGLPAPVEGTDARRAPTKNSRGDKRPLELLLSGISRWEAGLRRTMVD